ncbi:MAG: hypothetical protein WCH85_02385 [Methanomicrobiales archaeon]
MVTLDGRAEIEAGSGEKRRFGRGRPHGRGCDPRPGPLAGKHGGSAL